MTEAGFFLGRRHQLPGQGGGLGQEVGLGVDVSLIPDAHGPQQADRLEAVEFQPRL